MGRVLIILLHSERPKFYGDWAFEIDVVLKGHLGANLTPLEPNTENCFSQISFDCFITWK